MFLARACPIGPRAISWQPLHDARLIWTEALDGGDPRKKVAHRDKVMSLEAPFTGKPSLVMEVQHRFERLRLAAGERPRPRVRVRSRPPLAHDLVRRPHEAQPNRARSCSI